MRDAMLSLYYSTHRVRDIECAERANSNTLWIVEHDAARPCAAEAIAQDRRDDAGGDVDVPHDVVRGIDKVQRPLGSPGIIKGHCRRVVHQGRGGRSAVALESA